MVLSPIHRKFYQYLNKNFKSLLMKKLSIIVFTPLMGVAQYSQTIAQSPWERGFDIDIDPIAFALNGFSFHGLDMF